MSCKPKQRQKLKDLLDDCTEEQRAFFNRMYRGHTRQVVLNCELIDAMTGSALRNALRQVEATIEKNLGL